MTARASLSDKFSLIWLVVRTIMGRGGGPSNPSAPTVDWQCTEHARLCSDSLRWITPPAAGWFFVNNFSSAPFTWREIRMCLQTNHTKAPPAGFGGAMRRSRAIAKKHAFLGVFLNGFLRPAKICIKMTPFFVHIEGLRPCLSKPSYGAPKWALMVRLMQKKRPKSRQKSLF